MNSETTIQPVASKSTTTVASPQKLDPSHLAKVVTFILERNNEVASSLRTMLRGLGMTGVKTFAKSDELESTLMTLAPDILILSEGEGFDIFEVTKRIRYALLGRNPFTVILLLITPGDNKASISAALKSGADSALMKPVASGQLVERLSQLAFRRLPYIATTDYIGPERRPTERPTTIPYIQTINMLLYKLEGKNIAPEALDKAVAGLTPQIWLAQLKSFSLKLQRCCDLIFEHRRAQLPQAEVNADLMDLVATLDAAAVTTQRVDQGDLLKTCHELAEEIKALVNAPNELDDDKLKKIGLIPAAFEHARRTLSPEL